MPNRPHCKNCRNLEGKVKQEKITEPKKVSKIRRDLYKQQCTGTM